MSLLRKRLLSVLLLVLLLAVAALGVAIQMQRSSQQAQPPENTLGLVFEISDGNYGYGAYVVGCTKSDLSIPQTLGGENVVSVSLPGHAIDSLDVSAATFLKYLDCSGNRDAGGSMTSLDVSGCAELKTLDCSEGRLTFLKVQGCTSLSSLYCQGNFLSDPLQIKEGHKGVLSQFEVMPQHEVKSVSALIVEVEQVTYCGTPAQPSVTLSDEGVRFTQGVDYDLSYKGNDNVGLASVTITGKGVCTGKKTVKFTVLPPLPEGVNVRLDSSGVLTVSWNPLDKKTAKQAGGFEVRVSADGDFSSETAVTQQVKGGSSSTTTVQLGEDMPSCYVQMRSWKKTSTGRYYSPWSESAASTIQEL